MYMFLPFHPVQLIIKDSFMIHLLWIWNVELSWYFKVRKYIKKIHKKTKTMSIKMNFVSLSIVGKEFQILVKGYHDVRSWNLSLSNTMRTNWLLIKLLFFFPTCFAILLYLFFLVVSLAISFCGMAEGVSGREGSIALLIHSYFLR